MGQTHQSTVVSAPADQVWDVLRDFHDMSWAPNVVEACAGIGDTGPHEPGAKRILNGVFHETLLELDDEDRVLRYSIDDGPSPVSSQEVSDYVGTVRVQPAEDGPGTLVEWSSEWEGNDEAAADFCHGIYTALLGELESHFEG